MRQHHQGIENKGENLCLWLCSETGAVLSEGVGYLSHKGSYSTAVGLRASGGVVEWSGNPSRWGRADNVWGYTSLRECLHTVINPHLVAHGLPPFTVDVREGPVRQLTSPAAQDGALDHSGAVLTRVDLCRNLSTGSPRARDAYLRAASCAVYRGKTGATYPGSVSWGNRRNRHLKMYDKASELRAHMPRLGPPPANLTSELRAERAALLDGIDYRKQLADWCDSVGLLRQEVSFGRQALRTLALRELGDWSDTRAAEIAADTVDGMKVGCSVDMQDSLGAFLDAGLTPRRASTLAGVVAMWYMGHDPSQTVSRATWYRYCSEVAAVLGVDLRQKPDIAILTARTQVVELAPVSPPAWYRHAA